MREGISKTRMIQERSRVWWIRIRWSNSILVSRVSGHASLKCASLLFSSPRRCATSSPFARNFSYSLPLSFSRTRSSAFSASRSLDENKRSNWTNLKRRRTRGSGRKKGTNLGTRRSVAGGTKREARNRWEGKRGEGT